MSKRGRVLVIEDDNKIQDIVVTILEEKNFEVFACSEGKVGIKLAKNLEPLIVICDIMLPDIDGYKVCELIRNAEETSESIIMFLTAKAEMDDLRKGMNLGADDYLTKPFKANELIEAIDARLKKHEIQKNEKNTLKDKLDPGSKIFVNLKNESKLITIDSISAISAEGVYTNIWTIDNKKYLLRRSISEWDKALPNNIFIRTHRSYIVNQNEIEKIEPWFKHSYLVKMRNIDEEFYISERYASKLKKKFSF